MDATIEDYERELAHVQGNYPDDTKRASDIKAEIAKLKKSKPIPEPHAGLEPGDRDADGNIIDGRRGAGVEPQEGNPSAVPATPVEAVGNPRRAVKKRANRNARARPRMVEPVGQKVGGESSQAEKSG